MKKTAYTAEAPKWGMAVSSDGRWEKSKRSR